MAERPSVLLLALALAVIAAGACTSSTHDDDPPHVRMDFTRPELFAAPFPSDDLRQPSGAIAIAGYPNPTKNPFVDALTGMIGRNARGFATSGGVFLTLTAPIDPSTLPDVLRSTDERAPVMLVAIDPAGGVLQRHPIDVSFAADAGPFAAPNMLSVVPLQGTPLLPRTTYAVVVTRDLRDVNGRSFEPSAEMSALSRGERPPGLSDEAFATYRRALHAVGGDRTPSNVAALAVFTTDDPTAEMLSVTRAMTDTTLALDAPPTRGEVFDGYCVYNAIVRMPSLQRGTPPFAHEGGDWALDDAGRPIVQRREASRVVITVPRTPPPPDGYPLAVMIRTGGGGDRPLVDRGVEDASGAVRTPGSGPAQDLGMIGWAGASFDGPHGGLRNVTHGDEQFLVFNVDNVVAIRDNVRQTALETVLFERMLEGLSFDASDCPGTGTQPVRFDTKREALIGHSMGATIAPLALAADARFRGTVLGGAGASWMENVLYKEKPLRVRPVVEILLGYTSEDRELRRGDPVLSLVQWALEAADPLVYARLLVRAPAPGEEPRQILIEQGIVDHYIMPMIANALDVALGLDLAGDALDEASDELRARPDQIPLRALLGFSGRSQIPLPASGNASGVTAVVRQHFADGIQDGHEIMFQTDAAKNELRCFLRTLAPGAAARVPDGATEACR